MERRKKMMMPHNCLEFVGLSVYFGSVGSVGSVWYSGLDFLPSIKKFFNFPNFFRNYLIFNAFQI